MWFNLFKKKEILKDIPIIGVSGLNITVVEKTKRYVVRPRNFQRTINRMQICYAIIYDQNDKRNKSGYINEYKSRFIELEKYKRIHNINILLVNKEI